MRFRCVKKDTCKSPVALLKQTAQTWMDDGALRLSAALAYYSIFSIAPLLVIAVGVAGWFFGQEAVRGELFGQIRGLVGDQAAETIQSMVKSASRKSDGVFATFLGLGLMLLGASGVFGQLKEALNIIWKAQAESGSGVWATVRQKLLSFGMVLGIGFLLPHFAGCDLGVVRAHTLDRTTDRPPRLALGRRRDARLARVGDAALCDDLQGAARRAS